MGAFKTKMERNIEKIEEELRLLAATMDRSEQRGDHQGIFFFFLKKVS